MGSCSALLANQICHMTISWKMYKESGESAVQIFFTQKKEYKCSNFSALIFKRCYLNSGFSVFLEICGIFFERTRSTIHAVKVCTTHFGAGKHPPPGTGRFTTDQVGCKQWLGKCPSRLLVKQSGLLHPVIKYSILRFSIARMRDCGLTPFILLPRNRQFGLICYFILSFLCLCDFNTDIMWVSEPSD